MRILKSVLSSRWVIPAIVGLSVAILALPVVLESIQNAGSAAVEPQTTACPACGDTAVIVNKRDKAFECPHCGHRFVR